MPVCRFCGKEFAPKPHHHNIKTCYDKECQKQAQVVKHRQKTRSRGLGKAPRTPNFNVESKTHPNAPLSIRHCIYCGEVLKFPRMYTCDDTCERLLIEDKGRTDGDWIYGG